MGTDSNVLKHVKKFWEGLQPYPFAFKGIISKEPSADATNTDRIITGIPDIDDDEEAAIEYVEDTETESAIKSLKGDNDSIKTTVDKIVHDGEKKT